LANMPPIDTTIKIDEQFINTFIKAKSALSEEEKFTIKSNGTMQTATFIIGHSNTNTNKISITVSTDTKAKINPLDFSAKYLREILINNKGIVGGTIRVSSKGLCIVSFDDSNFSSTYYLPQILDVTS